MPWLALALCVGLTALAALVALKDLSYRPHVPRYALAAQEPARLAYEAYVEEFGEPSPLLVVFPEAQRLRSRQMARELAQALRAAQALGQPMFRDIEVEFPAPGPEWLVGQSLRLVERTLFRLEPLRDAMAASVPLPDDQRSVVPPDRELQVWRWSPLIDALRDDAAAYLPFLERALRPPIEPRPLESLEPEAFRTVEGVDQFWAWAVGDRRGARSTTQAGVVTIHLHAASIPGSDAARQAAQGVWTEARRASPEEALATLRDRLRRVQLRYPEVPAGLGGRPVQVERDNVAQARGDVLKALLVFAGVLFALAIAVRRVSRALAIGAAAAMACVWTLGVAALAWPELHSLSRSFAVVVGLLTIGLGVQLEIAFVRLHRTGVSAPQAIRLAAAELAGSLLGCVLLAATAFATLLAAPVGELRDLGALASVGVLAAGVAAVTVVPAWLVMAARGRPWDPIATPQAHYRVRRDAMRSSTANMLLVTVGMLVVASLAVGLNPLLSPELFTPTRDDGSAVPWEVHAQRYSDRAALVAVGIAESAEQAAEWSDRLRERRDLVKRVRSLHDDLPRDAAAKRDHLRAWLAQAKPIDLDPSRAFVPEVELDRLATLPRLSHVPIDAATEQARQVRIRQVRDLAYEIDFQIHADALDQSLQALQDAAWWGLMDSPGGEAGSGPPSGRSRAEDALAHRAETEPGHRAEHAQARRAGGGGRAAGGGGGASSRAALEALWSFAIRWRHYLQQGIPGMEDVQLGAWVLRANRIREGYLGLIRAELAALQQVAQAIPVTVEDLPQERRERFVGSTGRWRVEIVPAVDLDDSRERARFLRALQEIVPTLTGQPAVAEAAWRSVPQTVRDAVAWRIVAALGVCLLALVSPRVALVPVLAFAGGYAVATGPLQQPTESVLVALGLFATLLSLRLLPSVLIAAVPALSAAAVSLACLTVFQVPLSVANLSLLPFAVGVAGSSGIFMVAAAQRAGGRAVVFDPDGFEVWRRRVRAWLGLGEPPLLTAPLFTPAVEGILVTHLVGILGLVSLGLAGASNLAELGKWYAAGLAGALLASLTLVPALTRLVSMAPLDDHAARRSAASRGE